MVELVLFVEFSTADLETIAQKKLQSTGLSCFTVGENIKKVFSLLNVIFDVHCIKLSFHSRVIGVGNTFFPSTDRMTHIPTHIPSIKTHFPARDSTIALKSWSNGATVRQWA